MHHPIMTTKATTSQITSLTHQMVNLIKAEIRNPMDASRVRSLWWDAQ
jgi:hypothetical protein